jgi:glutathione S-transferase
MKLYLFPAGRAVSVLSLKNYLGIDCEVQRLDFKQGDQLQSEYAKLNPNKKMPTLEDEGFVLWESNAILFYIAGKHPEKRLWPSDLKGQADVVRWFAWENAHWDAESVGMVSFEKGSKVVMGLGAADQGNRISHALRLCLTATSWAKTGLSTISFRSRIFPWAA